MGRNRFLSLSCLIVGYCLFPASAALAGDITGTVTVKQRLTRPSVTASVSMYERGPAVELGKDAESDPLMAERARVVLYVESAPKGATAAETGKAGATATMLQTNRRFDPDIVVIPAGSSVSFPNGDPIFHNVFSLSKPKSFDLGNYPKGESRSVLFPVPGIVYVNCRLHPNMAGTVVVTPNRWFARPGKDGQYTLRDLPPGTYTVVAWHKAAGMIRKTVEVVEGSTPVLDFLVPIDTTATGTGHDMKHMTAGAQ